MSNGLFRPQATASYLRPDAPGTIVGITPPWSLAVFGVLVALFVGVCALGFFGHAQVVVDGRGVVRLDQPPVVLYAARSGTVASIAATTGAQGKAGDLLVAFDASEATAARDRCNAELTSEQRDLSVLDERLAGWNDGAAHDREAAAALVLLAQIRAQRDKVSSLRSRCEASGGVVDKSVVAFPVDATVVDIVVSVGTQVHEGDKVAVLAPKTARLVGYLELPEAHRTEIAQGLPVRLRFDALPAQEVGAGSAHVTRLLDALPAGIKIDSNDATASGVFAEVAIDAMPGSAGPPRAGMTFSGDVLIRRARIASLLFGTDGI